MYGRPGTGKDHLLIAAAKVAIVRHGYDVWWVNGLDLYQESRDLIGSDEPESKMIAKYTEPYILIVADPIPPKSYATGYQADLLYRILDKRYRGLQPTWCSLNITSAEEGEELLSSAIIDRLRDDSLGVFCDWPSYRKGNQKEAIGKVKLFEGGETSK